MKKYLLFNYSNYYPAGGFNDFENSFDTIEQAFDFWESEELYCLYQIIDKDTFEIVKTND
jgi:hypothetical protein